MTKINLKFSQYEYEKPDFKKAISFINDETKKLENAGSADEAIETYDAIRNVIEELDTNITLASIRNSIDTADEFYDGEMKYISENEPAVEEAYVAYKKAFLNSIFRNDLEAHFGKYLIEKYENDLLTFKPEIMEDLVEESKLSIEYQKLISSCKKEFNGEVMNLTQLGKFTQDKDRSVRIKATKLVAEFFDENEAKFDDIYDKMVKVRDRMAKKLGYENYVDLGYKRMGRTDYSKEEVAKYREQILETVVPLATELRARQSKRIGIEPLKFYDEGLQFLNGNAKPHGDKDWCVNNAKKMYAELSPETNEYFNFMLDHDLFDLEAKHGKAGGGYCTYIPKYKSPFIFANFNGTTHDVEVLTHEAGHAFQVYNSRDFNVMEYVWPGMESAEIHSMSMEFFTWPWMKLFFEDETDKFKFSHLQGAVLFLPYGALIDEFQHFVYENPEVSPKERRTKFRELEKKYLPHRDYDGIRVLEDGGYWFRQGHVFSSPFYYIDYTLAQVCAFQFWEKDRNNHEEAWNDYLRLCTTGGKKPFTKLLEVANLENPFNDGTIKKVIAPIKEYLDNVDDMNL